MIDLMDQVIDKLRSRTYPHTIDKANIDEAGTTRTTYPRITVTEIVNTDSSTIHGVEKLTRWGCQIDLYAKNVKSTGRKAVLRAMREEVDAAMKELGMQRLVGNSLPYEDDIARYVLRYECDVMEGYIYRPS